MHIIFITHYFFPEGNAPASRTYENCKRWAARGYKVTVITGVPNVPDGVIYEGYKNRFFQREKIDNIHVLRVWTYVAANRGFARRIVNYLSFMVMSLLGIFLVPKGEVVIATSPQLFCAVAGFIFSRLRRIPFVLEIRDLWPESLIATGALTNRRVIRIIGALELFLYRHSEKIVVVTDSFKEYIMQRGIPAGKIAVIKNGVDLEFFKPGPKDNTLRKELSLEGKYVISYIGTIGMAHALGQMMDAADDLKHRKDFVFLLVGAGAERHKLIREKEQRQLQNVLFIDRQPRQRIPLYYAASDVCVVTLKKNRLFETVIPSKMFEIMSMARPVVLGVNGESRKILEQAQAGIAVEPEHREQLKSAILRLYQDPQTRALLGANGRRYVEQKFNRDQLAQDYLKILETCQG